MTKHPAVNALFISVLSAFYSFLFIFISDHMEFLSLLYPKSTLQAEYINRFTYFIMNGNMKYIGYAFILIAAVILILSLLRRRQYDEYQRGVLSKCALGAGILTVMLVPLLLLCILSDPTYTIEFTFLFILIHWSGVLITDLIYVLKYLR